MRIGRLSHTVITCLLTILALAALASGVAASGSKSKTPEEKAAEKDKVAVRKYNDGVEHMQKAREIGMKGDSAFAFNYRATADAKAKKEFEKAVGDFHKAIDLKPNMIEAHNNLGYCFRKLGMLDESLAAYDAALAIDSTYPQAHEYRGETFLALGKLDRAEAERAFLASVKSPYADTLGMAIDMYKLKEVGKRMQKSN